MGQQLRRPLSGTSLNFRAFGRTETVTRQTAVDPEPPNASVRFRASEIRTEHLGLLLLNLSQVTRVTIFETIRRAVDEGDNDEHRAIAVAALSAGNTPASLTIIHRNSPALLFAPSSSAPPPTTLATAVWLHLIRRT